MKRWLQATALVLAASTSTAQQLRLVLPAGATRGTTATFRCYGADLKDTTSVIWLRDGLELLEISEKRSDRVHLKVRVPDDAALGVYPFALHTARGITRVKMLRVGALPSIAEAKDHAKPETAQQIALNCTVDGRVLAEDVDWYSFDAEAGQRIRIEAEGIRLGFYDYDLQFEVFGPDGELVVRADESSIGRADPVAGFLVEKAGTHRLALRDVAYRGSSLAAYRLHVGTFPRPTGLVPAGGRPGETITARMVGDLEERSVALTLPARPGVHELFPEVDGVPTPTPVRVVVDDRVNLVEGDTPEQPPAAPCAFHGVLSTQGEIDRYQFTAKKGARIEIRALARTLLSPLDPVLVVGDGKTSASNDDGLGLDGRLRFTPPADGVYRVVVYDHLRRGGAGFFYRLEVGAAPAGAKTSEAVPGRRSEYFGVTVPQGGRNATILRTVGANARDGAQLAWTSLPPGVTAKPMALRADGLTPLLLTAAADAPLGSALARPALRAEKAPKERPIQHEHGYPTIRVRNNVAYDTRAARALPVAVTAPAPYIVHAIAPQVPLVRNGTMKLPVQIKRSEAFDGTVTIRALWLPAGVSGSTLTLGKGKSEGEITLNANSNAAITRAPIVLTSSFSAGQIQRTVSSDVFDLDVQQPWITAKVPRAKMEQGQRATFTVELQRNRAFEGEVKLELGRVPKGVSYEVPKIDAETSDLEIALTAAADAKPGRHRSIYARLVLTTPDGVIIHTAGSGEIRVDRPLPPALRGQPKDQTKR
ncbi:MAG: PPC domain-containing protein [Planctomycetota bacterium]|nr:PPC domain-containing protein [Planctomycetota bacterium]